MLKHQLTSLVTQLPQKQAFLNVINKHLASRVSQVYLLL